MKKFLFLFLLGGFAACSDGDLQIEGVDFDSVNIQNCTGDNADGLDETVFFKIQTNEALILDLQSNLLKNEISTEAITSTIPGSSDLTYRLFSDNVSSSYFCDDIPPATPIVEEEIIASGGDITIVTTVKSVTSTSKTYAHNISITNLDMINANNERLTDTTTMEFGEYTTNENSSVNQNFSSFAAASIASCTVNTDTIVLYKSVNEERISLKIPTTLVTNEVTGEMARTAALDSINLVFKNTILNQMITADGCTSPNIDNVINTFTSTEGTVDIATTQPTDTTFVHSIILKNFKLKDVNGTETGAIDTFTLGNYTTKTN